MSGRLATLARKYAAEHDSSTTSLPDFVHGAAAAFVNILVTFPVNKVMFRQQAENLTVQRAVQSVQHEGLSQLYRGVGPPLLQRSLSMSLMFGLYDAYYKALKRWQLLTSHWTCSVTAALAAGSTEALLAPLERVQTLLQHRRFTERFDNTWDTAVKLRPLGVREYYRGVSAILLRNGPSNALFFTLREPLRDILPTSDSPSWGLLRDFFSGALLGASLSTAFFPLNVAKTMMQSQLGGPHPGVVPVLRRVLAERGSWGKLYRGVQVNFSRSLLSWGIINCTFEACQRYDVFGLQAATQAPEEWADR